MLPRSVEHLLSRLRSFLTTWSGRERFEDSLDEEGGSTSPPSRRIWSAPECRTRRRCAVHACTSAASRA